MVRHASWLPAVRAGEWTDAQTGVHSNLRGRERVNPTSGVSRPPDGPSAEPVRASQSPCGAPASPPEWPRAGAGVVRGPPGVGARSGVGGVGLDSAVVPQWAACLVLSVDPGRHGPFGSSLRL